MLTKLTTFTITPERKAELLRLARRFAFLAIPAVGLTIFAGVLAWSIRRELNSLGEGLVVEPTEEPSGESEIGVSPI